MPTDISTYTVNEWCVNELMPPRKEDLGRTLAKQRKQIKEKKKRIINDDKLQQIKMTPSRHFTANVYYLQKNSMSGRTLICHTVTLAAMTSDGFLLFPLHRQLCIAGLAF